ncbi:MAG TPA: hypothetical protein VMT52_00330 [Planctomycetota bacterium]|nr:hypothetical protein [Planctomycetota bacterium]
MSRRPCHEAPRWKLVTGFLVFLGSIESTPANEFLRGDSNGDERVDISDVVLTLESLFIGGVILHCLDASDANDSGIVDLSDPIHSLTFLFRGGEAPPRPFPWRGFDPSPDALDCGPETPGFDPPRPVVAADFEAALDQSPLVPSAAQSGGIVVSADLFEILARLLPGESLLDYASEPGVVEFMEVLMATAPRAGAPIALPAALTLPAGADGCRRIDPAALRGRSHDAGEGATPVAALEYHVEPEVVCGEGQHVVRFTVVDTDGESSSAETTVTLCPNTDPLCEESTENHGTVPGESLEEGIQCVWVGTYSLTPPAEVRSTRATEYDDEGRKTREIREPPLVAGPNPREVFKYANGEGAKHAFLAVRHNSRCTTPVTDLSLVGSGAVVIRMDHRCFTASDCRLIANPPCRAVIDVEGSYQGVLGILTDSGGRCGFHVNSVEALAQEEAFLLVDNETLFAKSATIQNGTRITKTISYQLTAQAGLTSTGATASFGVTMGNSQAVSGRTGRRHDELNALAARRFSPPILAQLRAGGKAELTAEGTAGSVAHARTEASAIYTWANSDCPGAGSAKIAVISGRGVALEWARAQARDFYFVRTGSRTVLEELFKEP